ncbi:YdcF family protein, partial [bacterium]
MKVKKSIISVVIVFTSLAAFSQYLPFGSLPLSTKQQFVQSKNYYLLTLLEKSPQIKKILESDPTLSKIASSKIDSLRQSLLSCKNSTCFAEKAKFTVAEISAISNSLLKLYQSDNALGLIVKQQLIPSGAYGFYPTLEPEHLLVKAWQQDAYGINRAIDIYALGKKPNYPAIDSIGFNVKDRGTFDLLYDCSASVLEDCKSAKLFFSPSLTYALRCLEINEREQAGDYEPMAEIVNKAAVNRVKTINWNKYKYTLILVPGAGPEKPEEALSAEGILRCRIAARHFLERMAPFIMVSGGKVHPYKTKYNEAEEMKKYLIETLSIPENAIIMEPHARHTTTNMRNCA